MYYIINKGIHSRVPKVSKALNLFEVLKWKIEIVKAFLNLFIISVQ